MQPAIHYPITDLAVFLWLKCVNRVNWHPSPSVQLGAPGARLGFWGSLRKENRCTSCLRLCLSHTLSTAPAPHKGGFEAPRQGFISCFLSALSPFHTLSRPRHAPFLLCLFLFFCGFSNGFVCIFRRVAGIVGEKIKEGERALFLCLSCHCLDTQLCTFSENYKLFEKSPKNQNKPLLFLLFLRIFRQKSNMQNFRKFQNFSEFWQKIFLIFQKLKKKFSVSHFSLKKTTWKYFLIQILEKNSEFVWKGPIFPKFFKKKFWKFQNFTEFWQKITD